MEKAFWKGQLERIVEIIAEGVTVLDRDGRFVFANASAEKILGVKRSIITQRTFDDPAWKITAPDGSGLDAEKLPFSRAMRVGKLVRGIEFALERPNGTKVVLSVNAIPLCNKDGAAIGVVATFSDITYHKKLAFEVERERERTAALAETLEREWDILKTIMENTEAHLAYLDAHFNFVMVNSTYAQGSGYTERELIGCNLFELFPSEENLAVFERVRDTGQTVEFKAKPVGFADVPTGGITYWDWMLTPVKSAYGQVEGLVLSMVDVTERVLAHKLSDALNDISKAISSTFDFDEILQRVVVASANALECEAAGIAMREDESWVLRYTHRCPEEITGVRLLDDQARHISIVARTKGLLAINDTNSDTRRYREFTSIYSVRSLMAMPLIIRGEVIGILTFMYHSAPVTFTGAQIDFANKLATSISLALENARLYAAEHNIADTLQEALLTIPQRIAGVEFGYLYRSATEAAKVGGDFYDLFELECGRIGIVIGDVSGKGLEAATLTSLVKNTIQAYALEGYSPAEVMAKTNEVVRRAAPPSMFVTVFLGILDATTGKLIYCSAGHPPAFIKRGTSTVSALLTSSPVIGAFSDMDYIDESQQLKRGDILINYTDGVTEARGDGGFFGDERLAQFIKCLRPKNGREIPSAIFEEVLRFTGGVLFDDLALLSISLAH